MAWQLLAAALPAAAKVAGTALSKPRQEDYAPQTDYMKKYLSYIRGRSADREVLHMAMQPALRVAGKQGRQMQRQVGYDVAKAGLGGSGIESQMRLSAGQQTQEALATATDKAVAAQAVETARIGEKAADVTAQIGAEETRAKQAYETAGRQWKRQLASDVIGAGASLAGAGIQQYGQNISGFRQALTEGSVPAGTTYSQFKDMAKGGVIQGAPELGVPETELGRMSPAEYAQYTGASKAKISGLRLAERIYGSPEAVKNLRDKGISDADIISEAKRMQSMYVSAVGSGADPADINEAMRTLGIGNVTVPYVAETDVETDIVSTEETGQAGAKRGEKGAGGSIVSTTYDKEKVIETPDQKMFRENKEFYEKHPPESLELKDTGHTSPYGRKVYIDQFGYHHSEITATIDVEIDGKKVFINVPTVFNGKTVSKDEAIKIISNNNFIDPETNEKLVNYNSAEEAVEGAKNRMRSLNQPDQPWVKDEPKIAELEEVAVIGEDPAAEAASKKAAAEKYAATVRATTTASMKKESEKQEAIRIASEKKIEEKQIAATKKYLAEQAELDVIGQTAYKKTKAKLTKEAAEAAKLKKAKATVTAGAERTAARKAKLAEEAELDAIEQKVYKETKERLTEEARLDTIEQRVYKETKERLTKEAKAKATVTAGAKRVRDKNKRIAEQYAAKVRGEATTSMQEAREQQVQVGEPDEKTLDAVVNTVTKFESGDRSERHNNPGAMVWSPKLQEEYPEIEKGDSFTKDGKTYYTAKFKDKATGERINKEIISKIWKEVGGDTLKFYSRWSGLPKDSATVKNYAEEIKRLTGA